MRVHLKGIAKATARLANGDRREYWYAWRGGPKLVGTPGTAEFMASYNSAVEKRTAPDARRFKALIEVYKASHEFDALGERTKLEYLRHISSIEIAFGTMPNSGIDTEPEKVRGLFLEWRDKIAKKSLRNGAYAWAVLARICSVNKKRGKIKNNPCTGGGTIYRSERNDSVWSEEQEAAFYASAPVHLHLALTLALWTGQRQGDLLRLTWSSYDGQAISLRQGKRGRRVRVPCGQPLRIALDAERAGAKVDGRLGVFVLMSSKGKPWTRGGFGKMWRRAAGDAGINELTFHDLRGSAVTRLALAGASVPEIATITGLSLKSVEAILDAHYLSRDQGLAESAILKLENRTEIAKRTAKRSIAVLLD